MAGRAPSPNRSFLHGTLEERMRWVEQEVRTLAGAPQGPDELPVFLFAVTRDVRFLWRALARAEELGIEGPRRVQYLAVLSLPTLIHEHLGSRCPGRWPSLSPRLPETAWGPFLRAVLEHEDAAAFEYLIHQFARRPMDEILAAGGPTWNDGGGDGWVGYHLPWDLRFEDPQRNSPFAHMPILGPWVMPPRKASGLTWRWIVEVAKGLAEAPSYFTDQQVADPSLVGPPDPRDRRRVKGNPACFDLGMGYSATFKLEITRSPLGAQGVHGAGRPSRVLVHINAPSVEAWKAFIRCDEAARLPPGSGPMSQEKARLGKKKPTKILERYVAALGYSAVPEPPGDGEVRLSVEAAVGPDGGRVELSPWGMVPADGPLRELALLIGLEFGRQPTAKRIEVILGDSPKIVEHAGLDCFGAFSERELTDYRKIFTYQAMEWACEQLVDWCEEEKEQAAIDAGVSLAPRIRRAAPVFLEKLARNLRVVPTTGALRGYVLRWIQDKFDLAKLAREVRRMDAGTGVPGPRKDFPIDELEDPDALVEFERLEELPLGGSGVDYE